MPVQKTETPGLVELRRQLLAALTLFGGLAVLVLIGALVSPRTVDGDNVFLNQRNLFDILARVSNVGILAVGMTLVILTGGIDLSVGSVLSLGTVVAAMLLLERGWHPGAVLAVPSLAFASGAVAGLGAWLFAGKARPAARAGWAAGSFLAAALLAGGWGAAAAPNGMPVPGVVASVMAVGLLVGCLNGVLVAYGGLQPFIATLATMISIWGLAWLIPGESNARRNISTAVGTAHEPFNWLGSRIANVFPVPTLFFFGAVLVAHLVLRYTGAGRRVYAIGGNEDAARLSGVPVAGMKVLVYGTSGLLAALAGALWAAQYHQGYPDAGLGYELWAIAAVVIGGTSLVGGRGGLPGTFMGVLMFGVLENILSLVEAKTNWQRLVTGAIIVMAVLLQEGRLKAALHRSLRAVSKPLLRMLQGEKHK
jgi:simple sugar transport system permease protein